MLAFWFVAEAGVGNSNKMFIAFMLFRMEKVGFVSKLKVASLSAAETSFAARRFGQKATRFDRFNPDVSLHESSKILPGCGKIEIRADSSLSSTSLSVRPFPFVILLKEQIMQIYTMSSGTVKASFCVLLDALCC